MDCPRQQRAENNDAQDRMSDPAMILEVGRASRQARHDISVRKVRADDQGEGGKPCLAIQPRLAQRHPGQCVRQVIHGRELADCATAPFRHEQRQRLGHDFKCCREFPRQLSVQLEMDALFGIGSGAGDPLRLHQFHVT